MRECEIPIYIKNSFNSDAKGTYISVSSVKSHYLIKGLSCIDDISLINIEGTGMIGVSGIAARVFQILHQEGISVILISQASSEHSICFAVSNAYTDSAVNALTDKLQLEMERQQIEGIYVDKDCAIMSAVGDEMVGAIGISGKLCDSLAKANINIRAISQGSSERNISVVVKSSDINRGLQAVHASFYLSRETISIGLIGPGLVGSTLLRQIQTAIEQLKSTYQVNLYVRGIMNSKNMLLSHEPIDLTTWEAKLNKCDSNADMNVFVSHILADDLPHAVIIDCTANQTIARHYINFLEKGIHVITPNKHANAGNLDYYKKLKLVTKKRNNHYLYEATVCAGLPVINTLQDILKTGDHVLKIEGIVSGTLSYIFNELAKDRVFSEIVLEAKKLGYTEPDPREDLSGMDVARKLVCLAREIGHDVTLDDVKVYDLVPAELQSCNTEEFLAKLPAYDTQMQNVIANANAKNEKLCYVGAIDSNGTMDVAIKSFSENHPFARLNGTDNMLIFHTQRYHENPLIIQGPGAGAEVTAAGIFADLLRLVSFLS
jgi:aspartokinase/homoserine dehydrogenase 1